MNPLLSLPRIPQRVARALHTDKTVCTGHIRHDVRRRASRAISGALARHAINPLAVTAALQQGDHAIANLMSTHAVALPPIKQLTQSFIELSPEPFTEAEFHETKEILRQLLLAKHIQPQQIHKLLSDAFDKSSANQLIAHGLTAVAQAVNTQLSEVGFNAPVTSRPLSVNLSQGRVEIECLDAFVMPCIADINDPQFYAAYQGVIGRLSQTNDYIYPLTDGLEMTEMCLAELIDDIKIKFGQTPSSEDIPDIVFQEAEDEYGYDPEYLRTTIPAYLHHEKLLQAIQPLCADSEALTAWYATAPKQQAELIRQLHSLARHAECLLSPDSGHYHYESDDYQPALIFLNSNTVYTDTVIDQFSQMAFQECMKHTLNFENMSQFLPGLHHALIHVAVANITHNLVNHYEIPRHECRQH